MGRHSEVRQFDETGRQVEEQRRANKKEDREWKVQDGGGPRTAGRQTI